MKAYRLHGGAIIVPTGKRAEKFLRAIGAVEIIHEPQPPSPDQLKQLQPLEDFVTREPQPQFEGDDPYADSPFAVDFLPDVDAEEA